MPTPTTWTDTGLVWTAADPLWPLELLNPCMIGAITECDAITGRTVPALLSAAYNPLRPNRDYVNAIHSEVSALIPLFVNHTDSGGNWDGQAGPSPAGPGPGIPHWDETLILAAIGDGARVTPATLDVLSPWYFQTYKILNLLRWIRKINADVDWGTGTGMTKTGSGGYYTETLANLTAASWGGGSVGIETFVRGDNEVMRLRKAVFKGAAVATFEAAADLYVSPTAISGIYNSPDGWAENTYNLIETLAEADISTGCFSSEIIPSVQPAADGVNDYSCMLNNYFSGGVVVFVYKFDGPSGRQFKDW